MSFERRAGIGEGLQAKCYFHGMARARVDLLLYVLLPHLEVKFLISFVENGPIVTAEKSVLHHEFFYYCPNLF